MNLGEVQRQQAAYDERFWDHKPGFETIRHTSHHLGKLLGKIASYCEAVEHGHDASLEQLDEEVIPDLLIHAARLANDRAVDLNNAFPLRTAQLVERFSSPSE